MDERPDRPAAVAPDARGGTPRWLRLRRRLNRAMPHWLKRIFFPFVSLRARTTSLNVSEVATHTLAQGVRLDVYWLDVGMGAGPAASLCVEDDEVLRLDCIGDRGHLHMNMKQLRHIPHEDEPRFFLVTKSRREQVEEAAFHLERNLAFCLGTNTDRRVRAFSPDAATIAAAAGFLRTRMHALLDAHEGDGVLDSKVQASQLPGEELF